MEFRSKTHFSQLSLSARSWTPPISRKTDALLNYNFLGQRKHTGKVPDRCKTDAECERFATMVQNRIGFASVLHRSGMLCKKSTAKKKSHEVTKSFSAEMKLRLPTDHYAGPMQNRCRILAQRALSLNTDQIKT